MSGAKHTPGPWAVRSKANGSNPRDIDNARTCAATAYGLTADEVTANARLIAAAPDMLAALQRVMADSGARNALPYSDFVSFGAAITKATGADNG